MSSFFRLLALACGLAVLPGPMAEAGPLGLNAHMGQSMEPRVHRVTFWGQPYPHGYAYTYSRHYRAHGCSRREAIHTRHGLHWRTVRRCPGAIVRKG